MNQAITRDLRRPGRRLCAGWWTAFESMDAPLCPCHGVPDAWFGEAYGVVPGRGVRCTMAGCRCVAPAPAGCTTLAEKPVPS